MERTRSEPYMTVGQLAAMWGTKPSKLHELARRRDDPLPIRYVKGKSRSGFLALAEVECWVERNTCLYQERRIYEEH